MLAAITLPKPCNSPSKEKPCKLLCLPIYEVQLHVGRSYVNPMLLVAAESTFTLINNNIPATSTLQKQRMKKRATINTSPMIVPTTIPAMT